MPINKFGIQVYSANDPDFLEWIHPTIPERPPYLEPQYRTGRWEMIDGVKSYQIRKVENGVAHGSQIYHDSESGNNRLFFTGAQIREQRRQAALIHGEGSERVQKIGRETMKTYRQEGHDFRTYGTKPEFNGYNVKSKWKIVDYASAEHNEEVLELTGDRTGNTIDLDLKFHFTRFEGNNEEALKDIERYKYYFNLASFKGNPKVLKATHRNSRRFWDECRAEEQRLLENELLQEEANIEIEVPPKPADKILVPIEEEAEVSTDSDSNCSIITMIDASMEVHVESEQKVSFSKSFSDDSITNLANEPPIINLKDFVRKSAPQKPGILASSLILGRVVNEAENSVIVRKRSRIPKNIMNSFNSPSIYSNTSLSPSSTAAAANVAAAASNEALNTNIPDADEVFPPPPSFLTPPTQSLLVTAPVIINFEYSESAPTVTPPTPFLNSNLNKIDEIIEEVGVMTAKVTSKLETRNTPPPRMMSLAEPEYKSISIEAEDVWSDSKEDLQAQLEEYHEGAEIDAKTIEKLEKDNRRQRKMRSNLYTQVNTLRVAGSAMSLIINEALSKFETPRFDMDLCVSETHKSTKRDPKILIEARKSNKSDCSCLLTPKCDPKTNLRCTHCELQWSASLISVIWNDAMRTADLTDAEFLIDHFNPRTINGPPPDYFSKAGELALTEQQRQPEKRNIAFSPQQSSSRRRIASEEISSADDSLEGRESLTIKREVVEQYIIHPTEMIDSEEDDWTRMTVPEFIELPESETDN